MKKLFYSFAALAAMVLVAGCAREFSPAEVTGDTVTATFTVTAPGIATKDIADGTSATALTFAAYDGSGNYLEDLSGSATVTSAGTKTWTVSAQVVLGMTYKFAFFAKSESDDGFYTFAPGAKTITADYAKLPANNDNADVFYAVTDPIEVSNANLSQSVSLKRPVAQVNVADPDADLTAAAYSLKVADATSTLKLTGINNVLNIFEGTLSCDPEVEFVEFTAAAKPTDKITVGSDEYNRLAMVYVLAGATSQNTDITITINAEGESDETSHTITREVSNVPIQANYRTNILGNIFTGTMNFTVTVDNNFETPDNTIEFIGTVSEANAAMEGNKTEETQSYDIVEVSADDTDFIIPTGTTSETITFNIEDVADDVTEITIKDENTSNGFRNNVVINIPATVDLSSVTVTVNAPNAHVVLQQGTYSEIIASTNGSTLVIGDGVTVAGPLTIKSGSILIENGGNLKATASKITNETGGTLSIYVELGGKCSANSLASQNIEVTREVNQFGTSPSIYILKSDYSSRNIASSITATGNMVYDFNGHTYTSTGASYGAIMYRTSKTLDIKGNGTVHAAGYGVWNSSTGSINVYNGVFEAVTHVLYAEKGTINVYGGSFRLTDESNLDPNGNERFVLNCLDANYKNGTAAINVYGGKFYNFDPAACYAEGEGTNFVAEGYKSVQRDNETIDGVEHKVWEVVPDEGE